MRLIKAIHKAVFEPISDLITYRALPTPSVNMEQMDPFLFLNHHGHQVYAPGNRGLPFGPHPHRGFETVTFILEGDLTHKDSSGANSVIRAGGVQWMTAGSGLVHAEISSNEFREKGGPLELLQLWVNLPAKYKMTAPKYTGLQKEDIPVHTWDNGKVTAQLVSGSWNNNQGAVKPLTDVQLAILQFKASGSFEWKVPSRQHIFFYVVKGTLQVNGQEASMHELVEFGNEGETIQVNAITEATLLFGYASPFNEPIVAYGPFVMNTEQEIRQAYQDYRSGKFGSEENLA